MEQKYPEPGFYHHYKHDPNGDPYNYTYEVIGIARNTEEKTLAVLYRPLYENNWMAPANYQSRPLDMFIGNVEKGDTSIPRFAKIIDTAIIEKLEAIRDRVYM